MNCPKCDSVRFYFVQRVYEYHTIESLNEGMANLDYLEETTLDSDYPACLYCGSCKTTFDANKEEIEEPEIIDVPVSIEFKGSF